MQGQTALFLSKTDSWSTPQWLFDELNREFHFTLDPCADEFNHKCDRYFTRQDDGLSKNWGGADRVLQSSIRAGSGTVGPKSVGRIEEARYGRCHVDSGKDGCKVVP